MPDIKSALEKALAKTANAWAADDEAHKNIEQQQDKPVPKQYFQTTNNVTRATFDYVHKNPGKTRKEIITTLTSLGYKKASTTSLLGQFVRQGSMVMRGDLLFTTQPEYTSIKTAKLKIAREKLVKPQVKAAGLASIAPIAEAALQRKRIEITNTRTGEIIPPRKEEWTAKSVIDNLNVYQAMSVYNELRKIFEE